uniref:Myc box-dependent-interacting protein 1 n=1 Tax=Scophthalmus maximus TaxID=52904 RepID=A0A8D3ABI2_SCOMX
MAELNLGKGLTAGKVASNVQKKLTRAQEKVLQKLGKADETKDVAFEEGVINFTKQYAEGSKLQRDLRAYLEAVKAMHESSKNVQACLADMYEPEWHGKNEVDSVVEDCDVLWTDYHQKLVDHALISMDTYLGQFPDIKARIAKRDRKLVDYDSARHNYSATHKTKKKDGGIKITKPSSLLERATPGWAQGILSAHNVAQSSLSRSQAEEELERAQKVFEEINIDLQEELPSLWNSRVGFYVSTFQSLAGFEEKFHKEMSRVRCSCRPLHEDRGDQEEDTEQHYDPVAAAAEAWGDDGTQPVRYDPIAAAAEGWGDDGTQPVCDDPVAEAQEGWGDDGSQPVHYDPLAEAQEGWGDDDSPPVTEVPATNDETPAAEAPADTPEEEASPAATSLDNETPAVVAESTEAASELAEMPPGFLFKVQVMHDYAANDTDELEMKAGDVVLVIPFDGPDEQDDGWLLGMKQDDWQQNKENATKGVFPENFTQRL